MKEKKSEEKGNKSLQVTSVLLSLFGASEIAGAIQYGAGNQIEGVGVFMLAIGATLYTADYFLKPILRR